jgi:hypothetical protein
MDSNEHRQSPRRRVLKAATIAFNGGASAIDCSIRNISATGACLEVVSPIGVPNEFTLVTQDEAIVRPCQVAWKAAKRIGVAFR